MADVRMTPDQESRFWARVVVNPETTCWLWGGAVSRDGYGRFPASRAKGVSAHRALYEHERGPIPVGLTLDHLCRNRSCVNPAHLEPVTNRENVLRGVGLCAENSRKVRCPKGHEYTEANTVYAVRGGKGGPTYRLCRSCKKASNAAAQARRTARNRAAAIRAGEVRG